MAKRLLVLGNKKYSSWSLRAWIGLAMAEVPCEELVIKLFREDTAELIARYSPTGRVPVLVDDGLTVHDSLAILEYVNEAYAEGRLWPEQRERRALARAVSAEMHAGFPHLRERMPMNLARPQAPLPPEWADHAELQREVARVLNLWEGLLTDGGGPFLFGDWSIADCMYLPVVSRLHTYAVDIHQPHSAAYMQRLLGLPAFQRYVVDARAEPEEHAPYTR